MVGGSEYMVIASMWTSMAAWFTPIVLFGLMNLIVATIFIANNNNNNKHHDQHEDQVPEYSSSRIAQVTSLLERAKSINVSSYIAAITTTAESRLQQQHPSQLKKPTYSSLSRLAQSIYFPTVHGTRSNGGELSQSASERQTVGGDSQLKRIKSVRFSSVDNDNTVLNKSIQISNSASQLIRAPSFIERVKSYKISSAFNSGAPSAESEIIDTHRVAKPEHQAIRSKSEKSSAKKSVVEIKKTRSEIRLPSDDEEDYESMRPATARNAGDAGVDAKADDFITRFRQQLKLQRVESLVRYNDILQRRTSN